ncbi:hypothetical protein QGN29_07265 [Temperatibacter marinus]|uniref:Uncharacterized protein n=1 Tax=Temperatibacter marinus TaxID=1456591 RepID=A0AA52EEJ6_9PROT|nr:hypothetical protein [Temperatibacter marinus]WND01360.1 hypothetical protein QGN29_07265 [Temperatibacter marinus]
MANGQKRRFLRYILSFVIAFATAVGIHAFVFTLTQRELLSVIIGVWLLLMLVTYPLNRIDLGGEKKTKGKKKRRR